MVDALDDAPHAPNSSSDPEPFVWNLQTYDPRMTQAEPRVTSLDIGL